jgi:hypothetical protein
MKRTQWFERQFTFGYPIGMLPFFLERLDGSITRLEKKVSGVSETILSEKLDGKWSVKQNIGHLGEVAEISIKRMDEMQRGISPMSPAVFEPRQDYNAQPVADVFAYFQSVRQGNLQKYKTLNEHDLEKKSLHPRLKIEMNAIDLALFEAEHDDHHIVRINEILQTLLNK